MRLPSTIELLDLWQTGYNRSVTENSLRLIALYSEVSSVQVMAKLSLGERDSRLMALREKLFGTQLHNLSNCPFCNQQVEWISGLSDIGFQHQQQTVIHQKSAIQSFEYKHDDFEIEYRLPTSEDIYLDNHYSHQQTDPKKMISACIISAMKDNQPTDPEQLPEILHKKLAAEMEKNDPQSEISIQLHCPECDNSWQSAFDISIYLWKEIDHWANQLLDDVYILAYHFGWSEHDILTMHPHRRQFYLNKLSA
jgi:hypothetical protein